MNILKVVFFTMVYNDPLIRMGVKSFSTAVHQGAARVDDIPLQLRQDTLQTQESLREIEGEWGACVQSQSVVQYYMMMSELGAYQVQRRVFSDGWNATSCD